MTRWTLWSRPRPAVVYLLTVELLTIAGTAWASLTTSVSQRELIHFVVIVTLAVLAAEVGRRVERIRRRLATTPHVNLTSVWTVPAALLTTYSLTAAAVVILYAHLWLRSWYRISGARPYRLMFSCTVAVISSFAARYVAELAPFGLLDEVSVAGLAWLILIALTYTTVNSGFIAVALALDGEDRTVARLLGTWQDNSVEFATLCNGALTAVLLGWRPWLVVLVLLPLYVLHRSVLIRQLEHAATTDEKTGLLNATSWQSLATNELHNAVRHNTEVALLMVDMDHFKLVNDRYSHAVGDQVLRAVGNAMQKEIRDDDLCGRFGGEEFVILMPETGLAGAVDTANRICARIRGLQVEDPTTGERLEGLRLSASIGVATFPDAGTELDEILLAADNAMFAAKDSGRNQVRAVVASRPAERPSTTEKTRELGA